MEAMLALVLDLHGWRGPVAFSAAGIFAVVLLARILSSVFARRAAAIEPSAIQGYQSREEIAKGLREEPLGDWLERMHVTAPALQVRRKKDAPVVSDPMGATINTFITEMSKGIAEVMDLRTLKGVDGGRGPEGPAGVNAEPTRRPCRYCGGTGSQKIAVMEGSVKVMERPCPICRGTGRES